MGSRVEITSGEFENNNLCFYPHTENAYDEAHATYADQKHERAAPNNKGIVDRCAASLPLHTHRQSAAESPVEVPGVRVESWTGPARL